MSQKHDSALGKSQSSHYQYAFYLKHAQEIATAGLESIEHEDDVGRDDHDHGDLSTTLDEMYATNVSPHSACIQVSLKYNKGRSLCALLDTRIPKFPIVSITAVDHHGRDFYLSLTYAQFLNQTQVTSSENILNAVHAKGANTIERTFLLRTPQICEHVYPGEHPPAQKLLWLDNMHDIAQIEVDRSKHAAASIQKVWRGHSGRARVEAIVLRRDSIILQTQWRTEHSLERKLEKSDAERLDNLQNGNRSATTIQARVRTYQKRHFASWKGSRLRQSRK